jgi:hypothetical protein
MCTTETALEVAPCISAGVLSAGGSLFVGNDGSRGNTQQISFVNGLSWSVYRYQMRGAACSGSAASYRDIGCYDMLNANVSFPLKNWSAMLGYTYNKSVGRSPFQLTDASQRPWATPLSIKATRCPARFR